MSAARQARDCAALLASGAPIDLPAVLVVAHPDDESLWAGAAIPRLAHLTVIHLTDGAPRDMGDASALGFATRQAYADARAGELDRAFALLGGHPRRIGYGLIDKEIADALGETAERLAPDLAGAALVITHPYEGGHPDHDSAAWAVRAAVRRAAMTGAPAPAIVEFACYHQADGERRFGAFWPDPDSPEQLRVLPPADRARVDLAVAAHVSQAGVIGGWRPTAERWRAAPDYDFSAPPPPGVALFDGFGWSLTSAAWRARAAAAA